MVVEDVEIIDIGSEGKALGKIDDKVVFVPSLIPGDIVDVRLKRKRKNFLEGVPVRFKKYSAWRVEPFCKHFGTCGGCKWQHLPYDKQLHFKEKQVIDALERIGRIEINKKNSILPSDKTRYYRNKLEYTFSATRWLTESEIVQKDEIQDRRALGFHVAGMFNRVLDIEECFLQPSPSNEIRNGIRDFALENKYSFYDQTGNEGHLRNVIIRTATTGETMVIVVFQFEDTDNKKLLDYISTAYPEVTSIMYVINPKVNDSIADLDVHLHRGREYILERMGDLTFRIGPKSFYQTNPDQAHELYKTVAGFADLKGNETVYDLYTGTGTIANFVASQAKTVIGVEYVADAVEDAKINAQLNNITNTEFIAGDLKDVMKSSFAQTYGTPDVIITDPPRAGMHKDVVLAMRDMRPEKIVYVSCNPATQARDISLLAEHYAVEEIQPVDMFPHTHHVENVAVLLKKG